MWWEDVCHRDRLDDPRPRRFGSLECTDSLNFSHHFLTKIIHLLSSTTIHHEPAQLSPQRVCIHPRNRAAPRHRRTLLPPFTLLAPLIWLRPPPSPPSRQKSRIQCHM